MKTARRLSWIPLAAIGGALLAQLDGALFLTAISICWIVGLIYADRNGNTGRPEREPISHVRAIPAPPARQPDPTLKGYLEEPSPYAGIPTKVGVHKHSNLCGDMCVCGYDTGASA